MPVMTNELMICFWAVKKAAKAGSEASVAAAINWPHSMPSSASRKLRAVRWGGSGPPAHSGRGGAKVGVPGVRGTSRHPKPLWAPGSGARRLAGRSARSPPRRGWPHRKVPGQAQEVLPQEEHAEGAVQVGSTVYKEFSVRTMPEPRCAGPSINKRGLNNIEFFLGSCDITTVHVDKSDFRISIQMSGEFPKRLIHH